MYSRYGNPYMRRWTRMAARGQTLSQGECATYKGVTRKSVLLVLLTIGIAIVTEIALWFTLFKVVSGDISAEQLTQIIVIGVAIAGVAGVVMMVSSIVLLFNVDAAKFVGILYAVMQGVFLGTAAAALNLVLPGVSLAALIATGIVFAMCLFLYNVLKVRVSSRFLLGLIIALCSFLLVELICVPILYFVAMQSGNVALILGVQAGVALFCVVFATITVFCDIQNIDYMVQMGADKKYEWILAFSLTTSLVYLYVQILELLFRIISLFAISKNK